MGSEIVSQLDARFQLDVGHHLGRLGDPRAAQFTLDGLRRRLGPKAARLEIPFTHDVDLFPTVSGRRVANVLSGLGTDHLPGNTHVSRLFVYWVHTSSKFRRKGLARVAMARLFEDPRVRRCSCARLSTGTRNTAHALYRDFGFVDVRLGDRLTFDLKREMAQASPKGIRVRRARPGDETGMARLFNASYGDFLCAARRRATQPSSRSIWLVAHRGRRLAAFVGADVDDEHAHLFELVVGPGKKREEAAAALFAALHRLLKKQGAKSVSLYQATDTLAPLLQPLGYRSEKSGGVSMFALLNLPQFLQEIAPLLERRLAKCDWTGTLAFRGEKLAAGLTIRGRRVTVQRRPPARADLTLAGTDAALTRFLVGVHTPLEPYLQLDLTLSPALTPQTLQLLETLFPRVEAYR